jgi:hypothetical protein
MRPLPACFVFSLEPGARIKDTRSVGELETRQGHESRGVRIRTRWISGGCAMTKIEKTLRELSDLYDFYSRIQKAKADGGRKKGAAIQGMAPPGPLGVPLSPGLLGVPLSPGPLGVQLSLGSAWGPIISRGRLGSNYLSGPLGVPLSPGPLGVQLYPGSAWRPIVSRVRLASHCLPGPLGVQLYMASLIMQGVFRLAGF